MSGRLNRYRKFEFKKELMMNINNVTTNDNVDYGKARMMLMKKKHTLEKELENESNKIKALALKEVILIYETLLK